MRLYNYYLIIKLVHHDIVKRGDYRIGKKLHEEYKSVDITVET